MLTGSQIFEFGELKFDELDGIETGSAKSAEIVTDSDAKTITVGYTTLEDTVIPRRARGEEVLHVISGTLEVEENGERRTAHPGDSVYLAEGAAPTYYVHGKTTILGVLSTCAQDA